MASNQPHTKRDVGGEKPKSRDEKAKAPAKEKAGKSTNGRQSGGSKP